jgi:hypothetical protein
MDPRGDGKVTGRGRILPPRSAARAREEKIRALEAELSSYKGGEAQALKLADGYMAELAMLKGYIAKAEKLTGDEFLLYGIEVLKAERDALKAELADQHLDFLNEMSDEIAKRQKAEARVAELETYAHENDYPHPCKKEAP